MTRNCIGRPRRLISRVVLAAAGLIPASILAVVGCSNSDDEFVITGSPNNGPVANLKGGGADWRHQRQALRTF